MAHRTWGRVRAAVAALAVTTALTGCTIPFVNIEVPIDLPDLSQVNLPDLPQIDLEKFNIPRFTLPIGVTTSVDEARQSVLASNVSTLSDDALVLPGYLTVGVKTETSTAPLCIQGDGGRLSGMDADIAAALASELGLKVRYIPVTDASSLGTEVDVIMNGRTDNPDDITIAGTYVEAAISFFHKGETTVSIPTDLGGKSVGLQAGSQAEAMLNGTGLKMSQKAYANLNEAFDGLAAGEVDYVLCEAYPGAYLASLHQGITFAGSLESPVTAGVAVLTSNTELTSQLQSAFAAISQNGILELIRMRWVGQMPTLTIDSQIQNVPVSDTPAQTEDVDDGSDAGSIAVTGL